MTELRRLLNVRDLLRFCVGMGFSVCWIATAAAAPATMRVDYYHTGNATEERFSLDRVVIEPLPWAGNPHRPIDDTNRGKYFFEVHRRRQRDDCCFRAGSARSTANGKRPAKRKDDESHVFGIAALSGARRAGPHRGQETRREKRVPRRVDADGRSRRQVHRRRAATAATSDALIKLHESGDPATKLDL